MKKMLRIAAAVLLTLATLLSIFGCGGADVPAKTGPGKTSGTPAPSHAAGTAEKTAETGGETSEAPGAINIGRDADRYFVCVKENVRYGTAEAGEDMTVTVTLPDENTVKVVKETAAGVFHSAVFTFDENGSLTGYKNEIRDDGKVYAGYPCALNLINDIAWSEVYAIPIVDAAPYNHGESLPGATLLNLRPRDGLDLVYDGARLKGFTYKGAVGFLSVNEKGLPTKVDLSAVPYSQGKSPVTISYDGLDRVSKLEFDNGDVITYGYGDNWTMAEWTGAGSSELSVKYKRYFQTFASDRLASLSTYSFEASGGDASSKLSEDAYFYGSDGALLKTETRVWNYADPGKTRNGFDPEKGYEITDAPDRITVKPFVPSAPENYPDGLADGKIYFDENGLPTHVVDGFGNLINGRKYVYGYGPDGHVVSIDKLECIGYAGSDRISYYSMSNSGNSAHYEFDENGRLIASCVFDTGNQQLLEVSEIEALEKTANHSTYEWASVTEKQYGQIMKIRDQIYVSPYPSPAEFRFLQDFHHEILMPR